jgi:hypothetical protein
MQSGLITTSTMLQPYVYGTSLLGAAKLDKEPARVCTNPQCSFFFGPKLSNMSTKS